MENQEIQQNAVQFLSDLIKRQREEIAAARAYGMEMERKMKEAQRLNDLLFTVCGEMISREGKNEKTIRMDELIWRGENYQMEIKKEINIGGDALLVIRLK